MSNFFITLPQVVKRGRRRTCIDNLDVLCRELDRDVHHLSNFIKQHLGVPGSVQRDSQTLILKGTVYYSRQDIETVIRLYAWQYVMCHECRSHTTILRTRSLDCHCGHTRLL
jgi:translation initiation factor 2 beta subunit (eIF-2beta)/eIF-5